MHIVVLVLGLIAALSGLTALVFGFSIKEFSFGSTLLIIGTTTLIGGLVMIGVAGAIRELNRIARALMSRPAPAPRFPRPGEPFDPYAPGSFRPGMAAPRPPVAPVAPAPMPPARAESPELPMREARLRESRFEAPASEPTDEVKPEAAVPADPVPELHEPAVPKLQPEDQSAAEASVELQESDGAPLAPQDMSSAPVFDAPDEGAEPPAQPAAEAVPPAPHDEPIGVAGTEESLPPEEPPPAERARSSPFDAIWPPRGRSGRRSAEMEADDAASRQAPEAGVGEEDEDTATSPEAAEKADVQAVDTQAETPAQPVSILKSGVVDGMAYTLYSDGSIEAELPSGTIRFASINELRMHLEKAG